MYCLTPSLSHVFQELLSVDLFVLGNIEFVLTMLGLCCSLEVARTSGLGKGEQGQHCGQGQHVQTPVLAEMIGNLLIQRLLRSAELQSGGGQDQRLLAMIVLT